MPASILADILDWSETRPAWQRDALRRLFLAGALQLNDYSELLEICKAAHGLAPTVPSVPLGATHLAIAEAVDAPVTLSSLTHLAGVNALAPNQTVAFSPGLTIVYGQNGAGKSGYTRILKRACRSRMVEDILGDVLGGQAPLAARAVIAYKLGTDDRSVNWQMSMAPSADLAAVSVFDRHCVPIYLGDRTDVAFRPFGLDVFDKLAAACGELRRRLQSESQQLSSAALVPPQTILTGTKARSFVDTLTALTRDSALTTLATLTALEEERLKHLEDTQRDLQSGDPKQRAQELRLRTDRFESIAKHVGAATEALGEASLSLLHTARTGLHAARTKATALRQTALAVGLLPTSGEADWRKMWEATSDFSAAAYPNESFPVVRAGAVCPFCQQELTPDTGTRLRHFAEFVTSTAQVEARQAEAEYGLRLATATQHKARPDFEPILQELSAEEPILSEDLAALLASAEQKRAEIAATPPTDLSPIQPLQVDSTVGVRLRAKCGALRARQAELQKQNTALSPADQQELRELQARVGLRDNLASIRAEVDRKRRVGAYAQAVDDTSTHNITTKSTELTKKLVTDQLRSTFAAELQALDFTHMSMEIQSAGGAKGALFHKLVFSNAPNVRVTDVLSEGESRALSLAAFFAELSTAPAKSAIIFDDPVSSLDHIWRERIGRRLVVEAQHRQVIVFTHDLVFLKILTSEGEKQEITFSHQYVRNDGQAGMCSPDLPWVAMGVKERLGVLKQRWQAVDALQRSQGNAAYEPEAGVIFGLLRETWEKAIPEVLLNDVVDRYRQSIESKRVARLHDISEDDCKAIENGMSECSRWMIGHDEAAADGTPFPTPAQLKARIEEFENWRKGVLSRRSK